MNLAKRPLQFLSVALISLPLLLQAQTNAAVEASVTVDALTATQEVKKVEAVAETTVSVTSPAEEIPTAAAAVDPIVTTQKVQTTEIATEITIDETKTTCIIPSKCAEGDSCADCNGEEAYEGRGIYKGIAAFFNTTPEKIRLSVRIVYLSSAGVYIFLVLLMLILTNIDYRHPRKPNERKPVSIVIPCYNDGESVADTVASVFRTYPEELLDVTVINDCSKDDSLEKIKELAKNYPIKIVDNVKNKGKARSLNDVIPTAKYDLVLCLDADTLLNRPAILDMVARMEADPRLGAVSCPYRPRNKGILPILQAVEYSMLLLTQGAHNVTSAMALWGGCLMVRKSAFEDVDRFNLNAITEDVDLAFRLNRKKWRVEQSFRGVRSLVPSTFKSWVRQKLRWTSGGMQCYIRHVRIWIKNPIQIFFILSYSFLITTVIIDAFDRVDIIKNFEQTWSNDTTFIQNIMNVFATAAIQLCEMLVSVFICYIPTFIYVVPMVHKWKECWKFLLVIPYSVIYFPIYMIVSLFGSAKGIRSLIVHKSKDTQEWVN